MGGSAFSLSQILVEQPNHKTGQGLPFSKGSQLCLFMKRIRDFDGKTLHKMKGVDAKGVAVLSDGRIGGRLGSVKGCEVTRLAACS